MGIQANNLKPAKDHEDLVSTISGFGVETFDINDGYLEVLEDVQVFWLV